MDQLTIGTSWLKLLWSDFSHQPSHLREEGSNSFQARRRGKPLQCLGEVQEIAKEMPNA